MRHPTNSGGRGRNDRLDGDLPVGPLPHQKTILQEASRKIVAKGANGNETISVSQALTRKRTQLALSGSVHAIGQIHRQLKSAEKADAKRIAAELAEGHVHLELANKLLKAWIADNKDPKIFMPHPDDFVLSETKGYKFNGPLTQEHLDKILKTCAFRDHLLGRDVLEQRLPPKPFAKFDVPAFTDQKQFRANANRQYPSFSYFDKAAFKRVTSDRGSGAMMFANFQNNGLPTRFRLDTLQMMMVQRPYERMKTRELIKHIYQEGKQVGFALPRSAQLPNGGALMCLINVAMNSLEQMAERTKGNQEISLTDTTAILSENFAKWGVVIPKYDPDEDDD